MLFFKVSNFQTIYFSTKGFLALKVRFRRKLLKKLQKIPIPTTHLNWKTVNHQQFPGTILQFYIYFRKKSKKIHLKGLPCSSQEELMLQTKY